MVPFAQLAFLDVGAQEMVVILVVALLIFGGRLPEVARNLGKTVGDFKRTAQNLTREFRNDLGDLPPRAYTPPPATQQWRDATREDVPPEDAVESEELEDSTPPERQEPSPKDPQSESSETPPNPSNN